MNMNIYQTFQDKNTEHLRTEMSRNANFKELHIYALLAFTLRLAHKCYQNQELLWQKI